MRTAISRLPQVITFVLICVTIYFIVKYIRRRRKGESGTYEVKQ